MPSYTTMISPQELSECDREPLHLLGHIQGKSGNVMFVTYPDLKIVAVDAKITHVPWIQPRGHNVVPSSATNPMHKMIGSFLQSWIPYGIYASIQDVLEGMTRSFLQRNFHFVKHRSETYAISLSTTYRDFSLISIEIEECNHEEAFFSFQSTLVYLQRIMEFYANDAIVKTACDTIFELLGTFDRGMVYRFNDDLSGEVIHEIRGNDVNSSYLGLRFPSTDIPLSARQLYIKNILRYIRDVDGEDVPILSDNRDIDLTQCRTRAVAKPHILYMQNMGVICSLSLAIVVEGELWGLFAFHGYTKPFKPSLHQRIACETIASMVSVRVEALVKKNQSSRIIGLGEVLMRWRQDVSVVANLSALGKGILGIVDADVIVAQIEDPKKDKFDQVIVGDRKLTPKEVFWSKFDQHPNREFLTKSTRKDIDALGLTQDECPASGFVYFREGCTQVMIGRGERARDVLWAGNPDETKLRIGGILHPRNSFQVFMQKARIESRSWAKSDLNVISVLRDRICSEHTHNWMMALLKSDIEEANLRYFSAIDRARDNSSFFAHMCHELRTPFHGVMGCLNILHDTIDEMSSDEVKDLIKTAITSGNHMVHLLNDILNRSKSKYLSTRTARDTIVFQTLAHEAAAGFRAMAQNLQITLNVDVTVEEKIVIVTDRTKVIQIVSNIVNNAIKFAGRGPIDTIFSLLPRFVDAVEQWETLTTKYAGTVFTMREGEMLTTVDSVKLFATKYADKRKEKWMLVSVTDHGVGMKPTELADMFEPYTQTDNQSSSRFQGTGLGLFICVSLCRQLNGFLACSSTPSMGTTVHVGIPVEIQLKTDNSEVATVTTAKPDDKIVPIRGPIVIVDDNAVNIKILHRALTTELKRNGLDVEVLTASGGAEAIEIYKVQLPSLIIIDYHMPDVDGVEATQTIRSLEAEQGLPKSYIISYTADASEKAKELLFACGSDEIMEKPPPKGFLPNLVSRFKLEVVKCGRLE